MDIEMRAELDDWCDAEGLSTREDMIAVQAVEWAIDYLRNREQAEDENERLRAIVGEDKSQMSKHIQNLQREVWELSAALGQRKVEIEAMQAALDEARENDRCAMGYLNEIRAVVGGEDFPEMVRRVLGMQKEVSRMWEQEPVRTATYYAASRENYILRDTRNEQLEIYEEAKDVPRYAGSSVLKLQVTADEGPLYAEPKPAETAAEYTGLYCAHCQCGVDASEVTYHEQHTVCGRVITDDRPPAAEPKPESVPEWQPIETAPRDGRKIIVTYTNRLGNTRTVMARWLTEEQAVECDGDGVGLEEGWYECIDNWDDYTEVAIHEGEPSSWMPLPEAHTKEKE